MLSFFPQIKRLFLILFDEFLFWKVLSLKFNRKYTETNHAFIKFILFWAIDSTVTLPEGNKNKNQESANVSHYIVFQWTLAGKNLFTSQYLGLCKFCHCPKISCRPATNTSYTYWFAWGYIPYRIHIIRPVQSTAF